MLQSTGRCHHKLTTAQTETSFGPHWSNWWWPGRSPALERVCLPIPWLVATSQLFAIEAELWVGRGQAGDWCTVVQSASGASSRAWDGLQVDNRPCERGQPPATTYVVAGCTGFETFLLPFFAVEPS